MEKIVALVEMVAYLATFLLVVLTPLVLILLPILAFMASGKWVGGVVFQALASLFIWGVLTVVGLYLLFLNYASKAFAFAEDAVDRSEQSYMALLLVVCLPYVLINTALICGLIYGVRLQLSGKSYGSLIH